MRPGVHAPVANQWAWLGDGSTRRATRFASVAAAVLSVACSSVQVVSVFSEATEKTGTSPSLPALTVHVDATTVHFPVRVAGTNVAWSDLDRVVERETTLATAPFAARLAADHRRLELFLELTAVHAERENGRLVVSLTERVTLRDRAGNRHVGQTHAHASASDTVEANRGSAVASAAARRVAEQVENFLEGVKL